MMDYLIGLDIGTTNIKALVIDRTGQPMAYSKRPSPFAQFGCHQAYYADVFWANIRALLTEAVADMRRKGANPSGLRGIAVSSMGEMGFPVGREDALFPAISWHDQCTVPYMESLKERVPEDMQLNLLGQRFLYIFTIAKLMWLKEQHPRVYEQMETWLCMADYVAFKLCGSRCMDLSLSARTGMLDYQNLCWSEPIVAQAGIALEKLPQLVHSGEPLGTLQRSVAEETGIPQGTPVFAGGHDHVCASFACGGGLPGILVDSSGTTEVLTLPEKSPSRLASAGKGGFNLGPHVRRGMYYIMGGILASGASVDWYQRTFGPGAAQQRTIGSLTFVPHLRGSSSPSRDSRAKGAFLGITDACTSEDFMQAVYEGLAFELRVTAEGVTGGRMPDRLIGVGGGYLNDSWSQLKANILETEINVPVVQEATAMGAALLAGLGSGVFAEPEEAFSATFQIGKRFMPQGAHQSYYREKLSIYRSLYQTMLETNAALSALN